MTFRKEKEDQDTVHLKVLYGNHMAEEYLEGKTSLKELQRSWKEEGDAFSKSVQGLRLYS